MRRLAEDALAIVDALENERPFQHSSSLFRDPEFTARRFHEVYEALAPTFGYETRTESKVEWADLPTDNRQLMIATCAFLIGEANA